VKRTIAAAFLVFVLAGAGDTAATSSTFRLVTLGDSITSTQVPNPNPCGVSWPGHLTFPVAHNAGIGGNDTAQMRARMATDVLPYHPTVVVVMGGTNDLHRGYPEATTLANMADIVYQIRHSGALPIVLTIPPLRGTWDYATPALVMTYNTDLRAVAIAHGALVIDTWALLANSTGTWARAGDTCDGVHPTDAGGQVIAAAVTAKFLSLSPPAIETCLPAAVR
jgi:lysophospholipase L1-like esterase